MIEREDKTQEVKVGVKAVWDHKNVAGQIYNLHFFKKLTEFNFFPPISV